MSLISHYLDNIDMSKNQVDIYTQINMILYEKVDGITNYYKYSVDINPIGLCEKSDEVLCF